MQLLKIFSCEIDLCVQWEPLWLSSHLLTTYLLAKITYKPGALKFNFSTTQVVEDVNYKVEQQQIAINKYGYLVWKPSQGSSATVNTMKFLSPIIFLTNPGAGTLPCPVTTSKDGTGETEQGGKGAPFCRQTHQCISLNCRILESSFLKTSAENLLHEC